MNRIIVTIGMIVAIAITNMYSQMNTIQLRNGSNTTTILPSASSTIAVQIPALSAGTHFLLTSTTNPGSSGAAGSFLTYGATSAQNTSDISATNYLFNVGYAATAVEQAALGGLITSTATGTNRNATALTLAATGTGTGTSTALYITNGRLTFTDSDDSHITSFTTGNQTANINYTLPTADGTSGQALTTNGSGTLSWSSIATSIDGLSDAKSGGTDFSNSLILGHQTTGTLVSGDGAEYNTGVGYEAIQSITTGNENTATGYRALRALTSGAGNTAFGAQALSALQTSSNNTAVGSYALLTVSTGSQNTAVGISAGRLLTTGSNNVLMGREAGWGLNSGDGNIAIGYGIFRDGEEGSHPIDVGSYNIAVGYRAMYKGPTGNNNIGIGQDALISAYDASTNIAVGLLSGYNISSGDNNTLIGISTGQALVTGSSNVFIGYNVGSNTASDASNLLYIDNSNTNSPLIYGNFSTDQLTLNGHVEVAIGTTTSTVPFSIVGTGIQGAANVENAYLGTDVPTLFVRNTTNSADANAVLLVGVGGSGGASSAGDAYLSLDVATVGGWSMGIDNSDSDKLKFLDSWDFKSDGGTPAYGLPVMTMTRLTRRVGIGTENPTQQLEVSGTTKTSNMARNIRKDVTGGTHTVTDTDSWIIVDRGVTSTTITLPNAADWPGRELMFKTVQAQTVVSNASNVVPIDDLANPGTAILPATDGAWATLVSDGTNWIIMQRGQ